MHDFQMEAVDFECQRGRRDLPNPEIFKIFALRVPDFGVVWALFLSLVDHSAARTKRFKQIGPANWGKVIAPSQYTTEDI